MKTIKKALKLGLCAAAAVAFLPTQASAVAFAYDLKFMSFTYNLAGKNNPYWNSLLNMKNRIMPEIGIQFDKHQSIMFGAWFIQNLHTHISYFPYSWGVTMYYSAVGKDFRTYIGIIPRTYTMANYPLAAFKKLFWFKDPTVRGAMFQYKPTYNPNRWWNGWAEFIVDWYGGRNWNNVWGKKYAANHYNMNQMLYFGGSEWSFLKGYLGFGGRVVAFHNTSSYSMGDPYPFDGHSDPAMRGQTPLWPGGYPYASGEPLGGVPGQYANPTVLDRIYYYGYIKSNLKRLAPFLDKLSVAFGTMSEQEHYCVRKGNSCGPSQWYNSFGGQFDFDIQYKGFGFYDKYYFSDKPQMKFYGTYGRALYTGLPWYHAPNFERIALYYVYKNKYLSVRADAFFNFMGGGNGHSLNGHGGHWYTTFQQFVTVAIDTRQLVDFIRGHSHKI
ncbi:hypothetical protein NHP190012_12170 [Helicobacter sp. NHP19-012]|uniref:Outer membrane protein n=1 Tax=Helicobacter gastrofelis TaxID=2849642 RepID=A0ABN6I7Q6_9HELI|nr:hypothetical protein [Helicobacter sp. NHP19-012]BCZ19575.1 hypothetical protein NHP190012_12170 [Helicobacter sp. NHP19-012]